MGPESRPDEVWPARASLGPLVRLAYSRGVGVGEEEPCPGPRVEPVTAPRGWAWKKAQDESFASMVKVVLPTTASIDPENFDPRPGVAAVGDPVQLDLGARRAGKVSRVTSSATGDSVGVVPQPLRWAQSPVMVGTVGTLVAGIDRADLAQRPARAIGAGRLAAAEPQAPVVGDERVGGAVEGDHRHRAGRVAAVDVADAGHRCGGGDAVGELAGHGRGHERPVGQAGDEDPVLIDAQRGLGLVEHRSQEGQVRVAQAWCPSGPGSARSGG